VHRRKESKGPTMPGPGRKRDVCEASFDAFQHNWSGFVSAVAALLGITIDGLANATVEKIRATGEWRALPNDPAAGQVVFGWPARR
jgi:hypothetical protein